MKRLIILLGILAIVISITLTIYIFKEIIDLKIYKNKYLKAGIVKIQGPISLYESMFEETTSPEEFKVVFRKAERNSDVIIVEINSPGGSYYASSEISRIIKSSKKPTICYVTELATSGAYLVASSCDYVFSSKAAIIGSIGAIMIVPEYSGLFKKLGINFTIIKGGKYKDILSGFRNITNEEYKMLKEIVDYVYEEFMKDIAANRNLSLEYVREIAEGKIYTAKKAKSLNLIDDICDYECIEKFLEKKYNKKILFKTYSYEEESLLEKLFFQIGYGLGVALTNYLYERTRS